MQLKMTTLKWILGVAVVAAGIGLITRPARATTVLPLAMADLVERSDTAVRVSVVSVRFVVQGVTPFRVTEVRVLEPLYNARAGEVFEVWQRGDGVVVVLGDPWLEPGDEGLAFLIQQEDRFYLTALAQSWWRLDESGPGVDADARMARRDLAGLTIFRRPDSPALASNALSWGGLRDEVLLEVSLFDPGWLTGASARAMGWQP